MWGGVHSVSSFVHQSVRVACGCWAQRSVPVNGGHDPFHALLPLLRPLEDAQELRMRNHSFALVAFYFSPYQCCAAPALRGATTLGSLHLSSVTGRLPARLHHHLPIPSVPSCLFSPDRTSIHLAICFSRCLPQSRRLRPVAYLDLSLTVCSVAQPSRSQSHSRCRIV